MKKNTKSQKLVNKKRTESLKKSTSRKQYTEFAPKKKNIQYIEKDDKLLNAMAFFFPNDVR